MSATTPGAAPAPGHEASVTHDRRFRWWDWGIFTVLTVIQVAVLGSVLLRWWTALDWSVTRIALPILVVTIVLEILLWEWRWLTLPLMRVPRQRSASPGWRVGVAVTFVPGSEPIEMLEETVRALVALRYPHDTWVLDEGDDPAVRDLCTRHGARHFTRLGIERFQRPSGPFRAKTKYGNYNSWLAAHGYERYDLVVAVDSDHILQPDYLDHVLGSFDDPDVAFVQPAQAYYNQDASLVARGAAEETYAYYSSILMAAQGVGYPLVVGCHNTHRVAALEEIGGFPPHEADDMVMTLLYRVRGWKGIYIPKILARGLAPADWSSYLKQQRRWARSVLDYKFRVFPGRGKRIPWLERVLNYVHGLYYLRGVVAAIQIASLILILLASRTLPPGDGMWLIRDSLLIVGIILLCDVYRQRFFLDRGEWGVHWRSKLLHVVKWPHFVLAALDTVRGRYGEYVITAKGRGTAAPRAFVRAHVAVVALVGAAWAIGMWTGPIESVALHLGAFGTAAISLVATLLVRAPPPAAYSRVMRESWREQDATRNAA